MLIIQPGIKKSAFHKTKNKQIYVLNLYVLTRPDPDPDPPTKWHHSSSSLLTPISPVFCRFVLPCQILLPPIKTVGSTIRQWKILPVKLCFINVYTNLNPKPTPYSNADTLNIDVQREKKDVICTYAHVACLFENYFEVYIIIYYF